MTTGVGRQAGGVSLGALYSEHPFGPTRLRNRIVMAPMSRYRAPGGVPGEAAAAYYGARARGGVGLIISEGTYVDHPAASGYANVPHFHGREAVAGWRRVLDAVHAEGALMVPQLWHVGGVRKLGMPPREDVAGVGPMDVIEDGRRVIEGLDLAGLGKVIDAFARAGALARETGFDGVAIHGAHGYLIDQFLWPECNRRTDGYGGSLEARARLACEVVAAIRREVGPGFPIVFRFSQWKMTDYEARIANDREELGRLLALLVAAGVDVFDVSTRRFWMAAFEGDPRSLARLTREATGRTVIAVGSVGLDKPHQSKVFRTKDNADAGVADITPVVEGLDRGDFDLIGVGRALIADPEWPVKVRRGDMASIKPYELALLERYP
ncbi:MAG: 12-oxophytodienoate reductase [Rhizobiales bacterium]|nr:12-oxophytodienoate reductase [Hyphomicrobiales bacterium]